MTATAGDDPFAGLDLEKEIVARARTLGLELDAAGGRALALHARAVLRDNPRLHLTTLIDSREFLDRHLGESLAGAALLPQTIEGRLLDLGSGNGYPGLPIAVALKGLNGHLVEAAPGKAAFLRNVVDEAGLKLKVIDRQVQRATDLEPHAPFTVITVRAVGNWERLIPRLAPALAGGGRILLWAGETVDTIRTRTAWRRLTLVDRHPLPGRDRSWIWLFEPGELGDRHL